VADPFWLQSESRRLEFKQARPGGDKIARTAVAFANGVLIEAWGTGIRRMRAELESYPEVELVLQEVTQAFQVQFVRKKAQDTAATEVALLNVMSGDMTRAQIRDALGLKNDEHFRKAYLVPAIDAGLIEMTIPDKPRSSKQKYRLTTKGMNLKHEGAGE
jgi:predicted HTH transcriptional regulator